jgi:tetratricopeptide (TPR) repeat protein
MRKALLRSALLAALVTFGTVGSGITAASADQRDPHLPTLFKFLKSATHSQQAGLVEDKIWQIWSMTHDPKLDRLMISSSGAMERGDYKDALMDIDQILEAKPDFAEGWNKRATVYFLMGDYEKAIADIDRTLELEPRHFGALSGLGMSNLKLGRDAAAADAFRRLIKIDPLYPNAKRNLKLALDALNRNSI